MPIKIVGVIYILIIFGVLTGCSSTPRAPITDAAPIPTHRIESHVVAPGETLYAIAWRYGLDYRDLAKTNEIGGNYQIYSGQVLSLRAPRPGTGSETVKAPGTVKEASKTPTATATETAKTPTVQAPKSPSRTPTVDSRSKKQSEPTSQERASVANIQWQWPLRGPILSPFDGNGGLNKGIDIRGELGEPVLAAAKGEVVYSGSGLRGYGNLLIVKHSEKYLSAYAHNRLLLVAEGDQVQAGQKIAEVGHSGTNVTKLHFEIRHDGQPVNPMKYLP